MKDEYDKLNVLAAVIANELKEKYSSEELNEIIYFLRLLIQNIDYVLYFVSKKK